MAVSHAANGGPSTPVLRSIAAASRQTGVSFGYLFNQAKIESGFDPAAKAPTSSATGLYQFTRQTWLATLDAHGAEHGLGWAADAIERTPGGEFNVGDPKALREILALRNDPDVAAAMAAELASDNAGYLSQQLGRGATATDLALAHFLGAQGAARFLAAYEATPDASAAPLFPEAAAANRSVFYDQAGAPRSLSDVHAHFAARANAGVAFAEARAPAVVRQEFRAERQPDRWDGQLREIEPMPGHLSLSFAGAAYRRLAALGGGS